MKDLCKPNPISNQLIWPGKIDIVTFKDICDKLHGYIPIIKGQGQEETNMHSEKFEIMEQIFPGKSKDNKCFIRYVKSQISSCKKSGVISYKS